MRFSALGSRLCSLAPSEFFVFGNMEGLPLELPCIVCPAMVDMRGKTCANCSELVSCIATTWRQKQEVVAEADRRRSEKHTRAHSVEVKRVLGALEGFRAAKKNKVDVLDPSSLPASLALLEGQACPWSDLEGCLGFITATWRLHSHHVYLRCSNNDPQRHQNVSGPQCKWSFNWVRDVDPEYAASLLSRRELEKQSEDGK